MTSAPPSADDLIARALRPAWRVVPVLGAGVSEGAAIPGVVALAEYLLKVGEFVRHDRPPADPLFGVVDELTEEWRATYLKPAVAEFITAAPPRDSPMAEALIDVASQFIVTLNYDLLIEQTATGRRDVRTLSNSPADLKEAHRLLVHGPWPPEQLTVLHLHGVVTDLETIVLDGESYQEQIRSPNAAAVMSELMLHRTMLFYGTTLNESYLLAALQGQINRGAHVLVCKADSAEAFRRLVSRNRHGILIATVPGHGDLPGHVAQLRLIQDEPSNAGVRASGTLPPERVYIPNDFSDLRQQVSAQEKILALLDDMEPPPVLTEEDVASGHRTVVIGEAGSGKSDLLIHLARTSRSDRPAILIRLGDQRFKPGQPERVLARWAQSSRSADGNVSVTGEAIEGGSLHFLLDGLDEVPSADQLAAAALIADLALRLPQHAFTVTSRPVGAASVLIEHATEDSPIWAAWQLEPGGEWQSRYLQHRGVALEDVLAMMPELRDIDGLLTTPFFLSRVVDLYEQGKLAGLHDLGGVLAKLIDSQLEREEPLLDLAPSEVRGWLREVSLAGLMAGRRSFCSDELKVFTLPQSAAGGPQELAAMLVQRLLLAENGGVFRFAHRILGEQLAAEALLERVPTGALLDCLVPRESPTISGVREDALLTLMLTCMRSPDWRRAVAARDPLFAATATPNDASATERRAAAKLLWNTYSDRAVWMWERAGSVLLDHASALGRLIGRDPESEIAGRIRSAIANGEPEQQGNAIAAWVRVRPKGFADDLRKVLADPGRNGVVQRQAAMAAEDCGYVELVDDLVRLVETTPDYTVQQTAGTALVKLLPPERRLELGTRLMGTPEAELTLIRLMHELPARELVLLAAAHRGDEPVDRRLKRTVTEAIEAASEIADPALIEAACSLTVLWRLDARPATQLAQADQHAAARGIAHAMKHGARWFQAVQLAVTLTDEQLREGGLDEQFVSRVEQRRSASHEPAEWDDEGYLSPPPPDDRVPTLDELVGGSPQKTDGVLLGNHAVLAGQVNELDDRGRARLTERIAAWWPDRDYAETIIWHEDGSWRDQFGPAAWLSYASALGLIVDDEQWAQVAGSGILFAPKQQWLREQTTEARQLRATELLGDDGNLRRWLNLFECSRAPVAEPLLHAATAALITGAPAHVPEYEVLRIREEIMGRLVAAGQAKLARQVADGHPELADSLVRRLAVHGDIGSQLRLATQLAEKAAAGETLSNEALGWMSGIRDRLLLAPLFTLLRLVWKTSDKPIRRYSSGTGLHDVTGPVMNAIAAVGGQLAVDGYDELLGEGGDFRWLRATRNEIATSLLRDRGLEAAATGAANAHVPALSRTGD